MAKLGADVGNVTWQNYFRWLLTLTAASVASRQWRRERCLLAFWQPVSQRSGAGGHGISGAGVDGIHGEREEGGRWDDDMVDGGGWLQHDVTRPLLSAIYTQHRQWLIINSLKSSRPLTFYSAKVFTVPHRIMKLVHWPLMGGLLHLVQRRGDWAGPQPA